MKKLILILTVVLLMFSCTFIYAESDILDVSDVFDIIEECLDNEENIINKPEDIEYSTSNISCVLSGKGKKDDFIKIYVYFKNEDGDFELSGDPMEFNLGSLGLFSKELALTKGTERVDKKECFILLNLVRGDKVHTDCRLIKYTSRDNLQNSLNMITKKQK